MWKALKANLGNLEFKTKLKLPVGYLVYTDESSFFVLKLEKSDEKTHFGKGTRNGTKKITYLKKVMFT